MSPLLSNYRRVFDMYAYKNVYIQYIIAGRILLLCHPIILCSQNIANTHEYATCTLT